MAEVAEQAWADGKNGGRIKRGGAHYGPQKASQLLDAIHQSFHHKRGGKGIEWLLKLKEGPAWAQKIYGMILVRTLPQELRADFLGGDLKVVVVTQVANVPGQGTCVIEGNPSDAPMAPPTTLKIDVDDAEVIE